MNAQTRIIIDGRAWTIDLDLSEPPQILAWRVEEFGQPAAPAPGLGDAVAAATKAVGVKPCGGCQRRREALNRATPGWASRLLGRLGFGAARPGRSPGPPAR